MNTKVQVEVLVDAFKDKEIFNKPTKIIRDGEEIEVVQKLLRKGDRYETTLDRARYFEKMNALKRTEKIQKKEEDNVL